VWPASIPLPDGLSGVHIYEKYNKHSGEKIQIEMEACFMDGVPVVWMLNVKIMGRLMSQ